MTGCQLNSKRWEKLDELFHAALERAAERRAAYVSEVCTGDDDLRQELESMLAHHEQAGSFIESPAYIVAAETLLDDELLESLIGRKFGSYEVLSLLGQSGMGQVYLAWDADLNRKVALKFLRSDFLGDSSRMQRLRQEARAASALNHPNIITVHQIGEVGDSQFIATEYVEGETLRQIIRRGPLAVADALDISIQIASALSVAHAAGILHRDIKPENVMVRPDGYVKVLDFGLAKLSQPLVASSEAWTLINTAEGTIVGTIQYMSPEQARGQVLDARTDIWSLGVVLYEILTAHAPFTGETKSDVIAAILGLDPLPLANYGDGVPDELQSIVTKALTKDRNERYQSVGVVLADLQRLKQVLRLSGAAEQVLTATKLRDRSLSAGEEDAKETRANVAARPTSSAEYIVSEIRQHKISAAATVMAGIIAITGIVIGLSRIGRSNKPAAGSQPPTITRLTTRDGVSNAAISPDGKYVAYALNDPGCCFRQSLRLRQVATTSDNEIEPAGQINYQSLTFSADGNYLYFVDSNVLYRMPAFGGARTKLITGVSGSISFSRDGRRIAYFRQNFPNANETSLLVANADDGTAERTISTRKSPDSFHDALAWSPTESAIACAINASDEHGAYVKIIKVHVEDGSQEPLDSQKWNDVGSLAWLADGSGLMMLAEDQSSIFSPQIWKLVIKNHIAEKITNDFNAYEGLSITADSSALLTEQKSQSSSVWVASAAAPGKVADITSTASGNHDHLAWLSDGQLLYEANLGGQWDIWRLDVQKGARTQLTFNSNANGESSVSPDGRYVVFVSNRTGHINIWRIDADGANPLQLTNGNAEDDNPRCSPDDKWVVYESTRGDKTTVWKVGIDGGDPIQLSEAPSQHPAITPDGLWVVYDSDASGANALWKVSINGGPPMQLLDQRALGAVISPDGKLIAARYQPDPAKDDWKIAIIPIDGRSIIRVLDIPAHPFWDRLGVQWSPNGRSLMYRVHRSGVDQNGIDDIWAQPIDGGQPKRFTHFDSNQIFSLAVTRTGELALSRGVEISDVVLLRQF